MIKQWKPAGTEITLRMLCQSPVYTLLLSGRPVVKRICAVFRLASRHHFHQALGLDEACSIIVYNSTGQNKDWYRDAKFTDDVKLTLIGFPTEKRKDFPSPSSSSSSHQNVLPSLSQKLKGP